MNTTLNLISVLDAIENEAKVLEGYKYSLAQFSVWSDSRLVRINACIYFEGFSLSVGPSKTIESLLIEFCHKYQVAILEQKEKQDLIEYVIDSEPKETDFTIDEDDLKSLYFACKGAYKDYDYFVKDSKEGYEGYLFLKKDKPKTFSEWINAQTIALQGM